MSAEVNPVFCIVGPTGCGKSAAAMQVAAAMSKVEIVAADSYTAWAEMDIGTAKPTLSDREQVPHHLVDIFHLGSLAGSNVESPESPYQSPQHDNIQPLGLLATKAFSEINDRDGIALAVGGSPLMLAAISNDTKHEVNPKWREAVTAMSDQALRDFCKSWGMSFDYENVTQGTRQKLIWEFETLRRQPLPHVMIMGIHPKGRAMAGQILSRIDRMWDEGLPAEVERLVGTYGWASPLRRAVGYKEFMSEDCRGIGSHDKAQKAIIANTIAYAWDQSMAFNRHGDRIMWLPDAETVARCIVAYTQHFRETGEQPVDWTANMRASGRYGPM